MLNKLVFILVMVISVEAAMIAGTRMRATDEPPYAAPRNSLTAQNNAPADVFKNGGNPRASEWSACHPQLTR
jgi:hypothetical protein